MHVRLNKDLFGDDRRNAIKLIARAASMSLGHARDCYDSHCWFTVPDGQMAWEFEEGAKAYGLTVEYENPTPPEPEPTLVDVMKELRELRAEMLELRRHLGNVPWQGPTG